MSDPGKGLGEIVIVRRRVADDLAAGKSGAWKIAYADFVTAMMAFFLVMWLINASNEETRAQVASYFNPIKLTDTTTGDRSLRDMKKEQTPAKGESGSVADGSPPANKDVTSEAEIMANPPASLERVATAAVRNVSGNAGLDKAAEATPSLFPDATNPGIGDPFDPKSWNKEALLNLKTATGPVSPTDSQPENDDARVVEQSESPKPSTKTDTVELVAPLPAEPMKSQAKPATKLEEKAPSKPGPVASNTEVEDLLNDIAAELGKDPSDLKGSLEVRKTDDGMLISLTENADFEMFKTGSAEPEAEMLKLVAAVAGALKSRPGNIYIRGHTDSRPFRNKYYDNWQLSTARAHIARHMLLRGGIEDTRIRRIEGVADREPRIPSDPFAPENRRIELLVSPAGP